jgi:hypothetical protein
MLHFIWHRIFNDKQKIDIHGIFYAIKRHKKVYRVYLKEKKYILLLRVLKMLRQNMLGIQ